MRILILLSEANKPKVESNFKQQKYVGIEFEMYTNFDEVMELIDVRGFYMDKLVIISSMFSSWTDIQRQMVTNKLLNICQHLGTDKEIFILDSNQYFKNDYTTTLSFYPQVVYQPQKVEVKNLFGLITGDIKEPETPNINEGVKRRGFFDKIFNRNSGVVPVEVPPTEEPQQETEEVIEQTQPPYQQSQDFSSLFNDTDADAPLFGASDFNVTVPKQDNAEDTFDDIADFLDGTQDVTRNIVSSSFGANDYDDMPLFPDSEPNISSTKMKTDLVSDRADNKLSEEQAKATSVEETSGTFNVQTQPDSVPVTVSEPASKQPKQPKQKAVKESKPKPIPAPTKNTKSEYVAVFQKRTKILLFTGERRSGISTAVSNCAAQAQADGLNVLIIDLDYERRGQAINFPFYHDENDIKMTHSLYNANKNPSQIAEYVISLEDGLDFLGTSLAVTETNIMHQHITNESIQRLLTLATSMYDLIFIDCPYEELKEYPCLILLASTIIHSMNTDHRSIINTLNSITTDDFDDINSYNTYMSKVMLLLNRYESHFWNGKELNERMIPVYIGELLGDNSFQNVVIVGRIPSYDDYDSCMEDGKLLISNKKHAKDFISLMNEIAIRG